MITKLVFLMVLDLFILTYCKPGPYHDPHKPDHGKPPWGHGDWGSHGWHGHPWGYHDWDHEYTTHRATTKGTTKPTTEAQSTDTRSTSALPQPTIRDIDLRFGEMSSVATTSTLTVGFEEPLIQATSQHEESGQPYSTPKFYTLVLKDDKKDKLDTSVSASDTAKLDTEDSKDDSDNLDLTPGIRHESIKVGSQPNKLDTSVSASDTAKLDTEDSKDDSDNLDLTPSIRHESSKVESQPNQLDTSVSASDTAKLDTEDSKDDSDNLDLTPSIRHESSKVESQPNKLDTSVSASDTARLDTEDSKDDSDNLDLTPGIRHYSIKVESHPNKLDTSVSASDTAKLDTEDSKDDSDNLDLTPAIRHESIKVGSQPNKLDTSVSASNTARLDTEDSKDDSDNLDLTPGIRHESSKVESQPNKLDTSVSASDTAKLDTEDSKDDSDNLDLTPGIRHESIEVGSQPNTPEDIDTDGLENAMINAQQQNKWHVGIYERELSKNGEFKIFRKYKCGGSLIKADMVISAGHCFWSPVFKQLPATKFEAAAGKMYREWEDPRDTNAQYVYVRRITITPMREPCRQPDLAFVRVDPDFVFNSFVKPVCINFEEVLEYQQLSKGRFATISSSAIIDGAGACQPSEQIHWRSLPYVDVRTCTNNQVMVNRLSPRICAGKVNGKDETQCESDSGNGLVFFEDKVPYLRGVASFIPTDSLCMKYNTTSFTNLGGMKVQADEKFQIFHDILIFEQCGDFYEDKTETVPRGKEYDADDGGGSSTQIIGSLPVPGLNGTSAPSFQWHVGVYSKKWSPFMQICGGSLVKTDFVISAAHCFWDSQTGLHPSTQFAVAGGKLYRSWDDQHDIYEQRSDVTDIIIPVRFRGSATSFQDDIAVLRLGSPFTYALGVQPVCLDFSMELDKEHLQPGTEGTVAGWGLTAENGVLSQRLNYLKMPYVDLEECFAESEPSFYKYITSDKICAGAQGQALCRGDSGSGLVISDSAPYLRGIASTAANNDNLCNAYTLAAFTHVYAHRSFLRDNIPDVESECDRANTTKQSKDPIRNDSGQDRDSATERVEQLGRDLIRNDPGQARNSARISPASGLISVGAKRDVVPRDTTPSYSSVPYNHFVCNCNCNS